MADVLIRDVPDEVLAGVDAHAAASGAVAGGVHPSPARSGRGHLGGGGVGSRPAFVRRGGRGSDRSAGDGCRVAMTWLIDKSALVRLGDSPDAEEWAERIERGLVRITTVTRLEVGYSARSGTDARATFAVPPLSAMPVEYLTPRSRTGRSRSSCCWPARASTGHRPSPTCSSPPPPNWPASPCCTSTRTSSSSPASPASPPSDCRPERRTIRPGAPHRRQSSHSTCSAGTEHSRSLAGSRAATTTSVGAVVHCSMC